MFQRSRVVEDLSSVPGDTSSEEEEDMTHAFHRNLCSKDPINRVFALCKITQIVKHYENIMPNNMDKKLLQGFYSKNRD